MKKPNQSKVFEGIGCAKSQLLFTDVLENLERLGDNALEALPACWRGGNVQNFGGLERRKWPFFTLIYLGLYFSLCI